MNSESSKNKMLITPFCPKTSQKVSYEWRKLKKQDAHYTFLPRNGPKGALNEEISRMNPCYPKKYY